MRYYILTEIKQVTNRGIKVKPSDNQFNSLSILISRHVGIILTILKSYFKLQNSGKEIKIIGSILFQVNNNLKTI